MLNSWLDVARLRGECHGNTGAAVCFAGQGDGESIRDHHIPFAARRDEQAYYAWIDAHPIAGYVQEAYREIEETAQQIRAIRAG